MVAVVPPSQRPSLPSGPDDDLPEPAAAVTEAADETEMPLPSDPRTFFLGGLFALGVLAALYVASSVILPVVFAFVEPPSSTRCPSLGASAFTPRYRSARNRPPGHWSDCRSRGGPIGTGRELG